MATLFARSISCVVASLLVSGATIAGAAQAAEPSDVAPTARVHYADLDLTSAAGEAKLRRRVGWTVAEMCDRYDARDLNALALSEACSRTAMAGAEPQVETALANARSGRAFAANDLKVSATHAP
jgi:UrcA family protein